MTDLVQKYNKLKSSLEQSKMEKAKLEFTLENTAKTMDSLEKDIKDLSGASSVEEAKEKLEKLEERINSKLEEANKLIESLEG